MPSVPAWLVSAMMLLAALCISLLSYMPRAVRLALMLPLLYFGGMYFYISMTALGAVTRTELIRFGLLGLAFSQIVSAIPYLYKLHGGQVAGWWRALATRGKDARR
jgi:hypothetical protein